MLFNRDFNKLLVVCLKMLFRKSTRKRFVCLMITFLFIIGFNNFSYIEKFNKKQTRKIKVLNEKAFKVFFLRMGTRRNWKQFVAGNHNKLKNLDAELIGDAFIYQNNLYIHFLPLSEIKDNPGKKEETALDVLYDLFHLKNKIHRFYVEEIPVRSSLNIGCIYVDHNGARLQKDMIISRSKSIRGDLIDISDMIREDISEKRIEVFNVLTKVIVDHIKRIPPDTKDTPNPYFSRIESVIPMNYLYILSNLQSDNTTDVIDMGETVKYKGDATLNVDKKYLTMPKRYTGRMMYKDIDIYPRYVPVFCPKLLMPRFNLLLYQDIAIKSGFMDRIDHLHFQGHYLFSYEKSQILQDRVKKINDDIHSNTLSFYLSDLSMGIAFPFMISLFAFIHLKTEIAFLLMFKNRIREILFIFWILPVAFMFIVKGGILTAYLSYLMFHGAGITFFMILPLLLTFLIAAAAFYPINKWCFSQFTDKRLNLYALQKGR